MKKITITFFCNFKSRFTDWGKYGDEVKMVFNNYPDINDDAYFLSYAPGGWVIKTKEIHYTIPEIVTIEE